MVGKSAKFQNWARNEPARGPHRRSTIPASEPAAKIRSDLFAEAEGKKEVAAARNSYTAEAARLQMLPDILASVVQATQAAAAPLGDIERLSIIGGAGDARDALGGLLGISPLPLAQVLESLKASGIDVAAMLTRSASAAPVAEPAASVVNTHPAPAAE